MIYGNFFQRVIARLIDAFVCVGIFEIIYRITGRNFLDNNFSFVVYWLYFTLLESSALQGTLGKAFLGLKVSDYAGNRIGFWRANARYWSEFLSLLIVGIGFLMVLFTKKKQALHDKIARTLVYRVQIDYSGTFGCLFSILYFGMGLVQLGAIMGGIEDWWGWPWWIAIFVATPIAYIPILGTVVGIMGAIKSFGWSPFYSILIFTWPYLFYLSLFAVGGVTTIFSRFRGK